MLLVVEVLALCQDFGKDYSGSLGPDKQKADDQLLINHREYGDDAFSIISPDGTQLSPTHTFVGSTQYLCLSMCIFVHAYQLAKVISLPLRR
jgi:hypothetical protein